MSYNGVITAGSLGSINIAAAGSLAVLAPLFAQIDLALFGSFGIGTLQAEFQAQLNAALKASFDIGLSITNPFVALSLAITGLAILTAQIAAMISGGIPTVSIEVTTQFTALAALSASLAARIGGLEILIKAAISVKIPAMQFAASLQASLTAGPVFLISWSSEQLSNAGNQIQTEFSSGLTHGPNNINPSDNTYGILLVTASPAVWTAIQATFLT